LAHIRRELRRLPPSTVVGNIEHRSNLPPWGNELSPQVTSLASSFVTSSGGNLLTVLADGVERVTGRPAMSVRDFVSLHAEEFGCRRS
jgi:hypothetical protein